MIEYSHQTDDREIVTQCEVFQRAAEGVIAAERPARMVPGGRAEGLTGGSGLVGETDAHRYGGCISKVCVKCVPRERKWVAPQELMVLVPTNQ